MIAVKFYTLLYIDSENKSLSLNGISGTFDQQMQIFVKCCEILNNSLTFFTNCKLVVLTNNKNYINNISLELQCIEIDFDFEVPNGIKFYASHHKIDTFRYFSQLSDDQYSFLIDSDVICINEMPLNLINCIESHIPVYYDITEQVYPAYGREKIIKDKNVLMSDNLSTGIWAGGEFIGGESEFFKLLYDEIEVIQKNYFDNYKNLHHQGDEALVSTAIERIMHKKYICNAGVFGAIGRFWSTKTLHVQNPWKSYVNNFLVHLPSDKDYIATLSSINGQFVNNYEKYLFKKKQINLIMTIKTIIKRIFIKRIH
jgi:hypothetical protein